MPDSPDAVLPLITNDAVVFGLLMVLIGLVFHTSSSEHPGWKRFYSIFPAILLCYFLPSLFSTAGIISGEHSQLYFMASRYLLPAALVLLTLSIDFKGILNLGPKAIIMFLTGTFGIVVGGPLAIFVVSMIAPEVVGGSGPDAVWRGMTTVAGSWIGGGANQAAMKEVFGVGDQIFSAMVAVDVIVANVWMAVLLFAAGRADAIDRWSGADSSAITALRESVAEYQAQIRRHPTLTDTIVILAFAFGAVAIGHLGADIIAPWIETNAPALERLSLSSKFFWLVVIATTIGVGLATTRVRQYEGAGASRIGSVFIYVLIATIGMKMDIMAIFRNPGLFLLGGIWMLFHACLMIGVAKAIKAPVFFMAVGSQANVGGAASAPVVASAFHPALAPVGVLLAVLGYAVGTYGAWLCGLIMQAMAAG